ncbi:MAG: glycosyltransferase family 2 protein [Lachnospiraceae bacterium]|nr:glycosyltransferase family 2 protein [Lachnospiraceae bacterium]
MKTTVIIPNYNGMQFLEACLSSLREQKYDFETILVDNASGDDSLLYVRENFPEVQVIAADKNEGFSAAVNRGIKAATTPYVLLLNNDTRVEKDFVKNLETALDKKTDYFGIQAKMCMMSEPDRMDDAGDLYCALGWAFAIGKGKPQKNYNRFYPVFAPCAGAAIYRKEVMGEIGFFDEAHFAYLEDIDIAYRAKIAGYKNGFCPDAVVLHVGSGSSGSRYNAFKVRLAARNSVYLIYKNMPFLQVLINLPFLVFGFLVKTAFFVKKGFGKEYVKALLEGFSMMKKADIRSNKVKFKWKNLGNYVKIQLELWIGVVRRITG